MTGADCGANTVLFSLGVFFIHLFSFINRFNLVILVMSNKLMVSKNHLAKTSQKKSQGLSITVFKPEANESVFSNVFCMRPVTMQVCPRPSVGERLSASTELNPI